jgi:hypothetical protein
MLRYINSQNTQIHRSLSKFPINYQTFNTVSNGLDSIPFITISRVNWIINSSLRRLF